MATKPAPAPAQIVDFKPTGIVELEDVMRGVEPQPNPEPAPAPAPAPTPAPAPVVRSDEEVPGDISQFTPIKPPSGEDNEPAPAPAPRKDKLREETERLAREKRELEAQLATMRQQHESGTQAYEAAQAELNSLRHEHERLVAQASMGNPMAHPSVRSLTEPWNNRIPQVAIELQEAGMNAKDLDRWLGDRVTQYVKAGEPGTDEFAASMASLRDEVDNFLAPIRRESDKVSAQAKIMGMIRDGAAIGRQVQAQVQEIVNNAPTFRHKEQLAVYEAEARGYEQIERDAFNPTEDLRHADPYNAKVILRAMIDGSEEVRNAAEIHKKFWRMASLPPKPLPLEEVQRMSPEQANAAQMRILEQHNNIIKYARQVGPEAMLALAVLPAMWKELEDLREQVKGDRQNPRPRLGEQHKAQELEQPVSITEFQPVSPNLAEIPL